MHGGYASIEVQYLTKFDIPGREYATFPSAQWLTKESRAVAFGDRCVDIDGQNCQPCLLYNKMRALVPDIDKKFPVWSLYHAHYKTWRNLLVEYLGLEVDQAKSALIKLFFLGKPWSSDIPFMWKLAAELEEAADIFLSFPEYDYLKGRFEDRTNTRASKLAYIAGALEAKMLHAAEARLAECLPSSVVVSYMFDGLVVMHVSKDQAGAFLKKLGDVEGVTFAVKPWPVPASA